MRPATLPILLYFLPLLCIPFAANAAGDPFGTEALLPLKPALRLNGAVGDPCADAMPRGVLDLSATVNLALCNNPLTREAWASSLAQAAQVGVDKGRFLPGLSLSVARNRNSPGTNQRSIGLTLSYLLFDFGERAADLENSRQLLAAAKATQDSTVQAVFLAAVQAFYRTQAAQTVLEAARESERAAKQSADAAEARHRAGSATPADKLQARTAWSQTTLDRIRAQGGWKKTQGSLANIIGFEAGMNITLTPPPPVPRLTGDAASADGDDLKTFEQDVNALIEEAKHIRPDLAAAEAQVKAAEANVDAARSAAKPSVSLNLSTDQVNAAGVTSSGSSLGVNINVPLFSGYGPTYRIRAAESQVESRQAQLERVRLQVALEVWNAYHDLTTATQSLRTSADLLLSAEQSERVALGRYQAGVGNILDVLNAQSALAGARQQRIQSTLDWNIGRAALAQAMGNLDGDLLQSLSPAAAERETP